MNFSRKLTWGALVAALAFIFILTGCNNGSTGDGGKATQLSATAANFDEVFKSVRYKPGNYVINLKEDLIDYPGIDKYNAEVNITVKGTGSNKITWKFAGNTLFSVFAGKLTLENINLSSSAGNTQECPPIIVVYGGTLEIKNGVTLSNNVGNQFYDGVVINNAAFIMSGGTIEKCAYGVGGSGTNVSITMSGGIIRNNAYGGIFGFGSNISITMSGGSIGGNAGWGVVIEGKNCEFEKQKGAVIYGKTGADKNGGGAIRLKLPLTDSNILSLTTDAASNDVYAAKINERGNGLVAGSQIGTWD